MSGQYDLSEIDSDAEVSKSSRNCQFTWKCRKLILRMKKSDSLRIILGDFDISR